MIRSKEMHVERQPILKKLTAEQSYIDKWKRSLGE